MKHINKGKVIIASDVHQRLSFYNIILEREKDFDFFVTLGDFFDNFNLPDNELIFNVKNTCDWINSKLDDDRFIWLAGNHDVSYIASYNPSHIPPKMNWYYCSGWTRSKATEFNRHINPKWFSKIELCCAVGDFIVSHGGFHVDKFLPQLDKKENIERLYQSWERDKLVFSKKPQHWIWEVGRYRGGMDRVGSPVWLDFFEEFKPIEDVKQIVGHTNSAANPTCKTSKDGLENWCLDNEQSYYAVWENGKLEIKRVSHDDYRDYLKKI